MEPWILITTRWKFPLHWWAPGKSFAVEIKTGAVQILFQQFPPAWGGKKVRGKTISTITEPATVFRRISRPSAFRYLCLMAGELGRLRHLRPFSRFDDEFPMVRCRRCLSPTYTTLGQLFLSLTPQNFLDILFTFFFLVNGLILGILCAHKNEPKIVQLHNELSETKAKKFN